VCRLDRLLVEIAGSSSVADAVNSEARCPTPVKTMHAVTQSARFVVAESHQSPASRTWYIGMLANRLQRTDGKLRGRKYGRVDVIPTDTTSDYHLEDVWELHSYLQVSFYCRLKS